MIFMTFISIHFVIIFDVLFWRTYETHMALPLKSGCDRSSIKGNVDYRMKTGQNPYLLTFTLILSILILILSHLLLFYSDYSYLFYSRKTRRILHLGILHLRPLKEIGDLRQKILFSLSKVFGCLF
jgi:hypothetical protein